MSEIIEGNFTETSLVPAPSASALQCVFGDISTEEGLRKAIATVENGMKLKKHAIILATGTGTPEAWIDMGGEPYCSEAECERILAMIGANVDLVRKEFEQDPDGSGHFGIEIEVRLEHPLLGRWTGLGYAHSTDDFIGTNNGKPSKYGKVKTVEDISRHNIQQHAFTRAKGNVTRKVMGLSGYSWESLKENFGYERGKGGSVSFMKRSLEPRPSHGTFGEKLAKVKEERAEREEHIQKREPEEPKPAEPKEPDGSLRNDLVGASKKANLKFKEIGAWAKKELGYTGKILEAPADIQRQTISAIQAGKISKGA